MALTLNLDQNSRHLSIVTYKAFSRSFSGHLVYVLFLHSKLLDWSFTFSKRYLILELSSQYIFNITGAVLLVVGSELTFYMESYMGNSHILIIKA